MKYITRWFKEQYNVEAKNAVTTNSVYFTLFNKIIRFSDHISNGNCGYNKFDLQVIVMHDINTANKSFIVFEYPYPTPLSVPDVKTLKTVLSTYMFMYSNTYGKQTVKVKEEKHNIVLMRESVKEIRKSKEASAEYYKYKGLIFTGMAEYLPHWPQMSKAIKTVVCDLLYAGVEVDDLLNALNKQYKSSEYGKLHGISAVDFLNIMQPHFPNIITVENFPVLNIQANGEDDVDTSISLPENSTDNDNAVETSNDIKATVSIPNECSVNITIETYTKESLDNLIYIANHINNRKKKSFKDIIDKGALIDVTKKYNAANAAQYVKLESILELYLNETDEYKKDVYSLKLNEAFGSLFGNVSKLKTRLFTQSQRKQWRGAYIAGVPFVTVMLACETYMCKEGSKYTPTHNKLNALIGSFIIFYKIYTEHPDKLQMPDIDSSTVITDDVNVNKTAATVITIPEKLTVQQSNSVTCPKLSKTEVEIKEDLIKSYGYIIHDYKIPNVRDHISQNDKDLLSDAIATIFRNNGKSTSFERRKVMTAYENIYTDIWSNLTHTQRELCTGLITDEQLSINEANYAIRKMFPLGRLWPKTEECRKVLKALAFTIKSKRIVA